MKSVLKWIREALESSGALYCIYSRDDLINRPDRLAGRDQNLRGATTRPPQKRASEQGE